MYKEKELIKVTGELLSTAKQGVAYAVRDEQGYCDYKVVTKVGSKYEIESVWEREKGIYTTEEVKGDANSSQWIVIDEQAITEGIKEMVKGGEIRKEAEMDFEQLIQLTLYLYNQWAEGEKILGQYNVLDSNGNGK